ncbi:MAG: hypothetical protein KDA33_04905, partial [Phycisphaerales bacterium]|nr:hypothetical protein [Phycisphaerales bacterium]
TPGSIRIRYLQGLALVVESRIDQAAKTLEQEEPGKGESSDESDQARGAVDYDAAIISKLHAAASVFASLESTDPGRTEAELQLAYCFFTLGIAYRLQGRIDLATPMMEQNYALSLRQYAAQPGAVDRLITLMETRFELLRLEIKFSGGDLSMARSELLDMVSVLSGLESSVAYDCYRPRIDGLRQICLQAIKVIGPSP